MVRPQSRPVTRARWVLARNRPGEFVRLVRLPPGAVLASDVPAPRRPQASTDDYAQRTATF